MTTNNTSTTFHKSFLPTTAKIRLNREYQPFVKFNLGKGLGLGKFYPIVEIFFDVNNRLVARYRTKDKSEGAQTYGYAVIGTAVLEKKEEAFRHE